MARVRAQAIEPEVVTDPRDYVMARLAAGRAAAQAAIDAIDEAMILFINPADDKTGKDRKDNVEDALENMGAACRALEAAEEEIGEVDMTAEEPWEGDED